VQELALRTQAAAARQRDRAQAVHRWAAAQELLVRQEAALRLVAELSHPLQAVRPAATKPAAVAARTASRALAPRGSLPSHSSGWVRFADESCTSLRSPTLADTVSACEVRGEAMVLLDRLRRLLDRRSPDATSHV
jgi:hypothetical protein